ncbi:hypothetical protein DUNSADRAFT_14974 [Dunaliella salina]|uniref:Uncharacterized protein n=1 Tax=Dunaliella salina TaxID=3046 RepID=A0ABQ7H282_DUNSA|nr:hypothetical protein DUNSADRAFT_14974 [Dunaliella salina]|eukprot:KAF5840950.1 hypothetical protein DUNSADRAFT_14974 [Dunaliella salina]
MRCCTNACSNHAGTTKTGAHVTRVLAPAAPYAPAAAAAAAAATAHTGFDGGCTPSRQGQRQPAAASFCGRHGLSSDGKRLGSCDSRFRRQSSDWRRLRRSNRCAAIPVAASAAPSASVPSRNASSITFSGQASPEPQLPSHVPSHSSTATSADIPGNPCTADSAPHYPAAHKPLGNPAQQMPLLAPNFSTSNALGKVQQQEPPGPGTTLQNMPCLSVGPVELADALGVPVRSARALLSQHGGPLRQLTVLTFAARQPEVLRTDATPAAVAAQVRQMAASLGLHPNLFAGLVARQPEFLEGSTPTCCTFPHLQSEPKLTPGHALPPPSQPFPDSQNSLSSGTSGKEGRGLPQPSPSPPAPHTSPMQTDSDQSRSEQSTRHASSRPLPSSPFSLPSYSPSTANPSSQSRHSSAPALNSPLPVPRSNPLPNPASAPSSSVPLPTPTSHACVPSPPGDTLLEPLLGRARSGAEHHYKSGSSSSRSSNSSTTLVRPLSPRATHAHTIAHDPSPTPATRFPSAQQHMHTLQFPGASSIQPNSKVTDPGREMEEKSGATAHAVEAEQRGRQAATAMRRLARKAAQVEAKARTRMAGLSVMARLPATEFFMLIALPSAALQRRLLQLEGILLNQGTPVAAATPGTSTTHGSIPAGTLGGADTRAGPWKASSSLQRQSSPAWSRTGSGADAWGIPRAASSSLQRQRSPAWSQAVSGERRGFSSKQSFGREDVWGEYVRGLHTYSRSSSGSGGGGGREMGALSGNHASNILISFGSSSNGRPGQQQQQQQQEAQPCLHPFRTFQSSVFYAPGLHWIVEPASPSAAAGVSTPARSSAALSRPLPDSQRGVRGSSPKGTGTQNVAHGSSAIAASQQGAGDRAGGTDSSSSSSSPSMGTRIQNGAHGSSAIMASQRGAADRMYGSGSSSSSSSKGTRASRSQSLHLTLMEGADMDDDCVSGAGLWGHPTLGTGNNNSSSGRSTNSSPDGGGSVGSDSSSGGTGNGGGGVGREGYGVIDVRGIVASCPMLLVAPLREVSCSWRALCALLGPHSKTAQRCALIARDPALLLVPPRSLKAAMDWLCSELGMSATQAASCVLQQPKLLKRDPDALLAQVQELSAVWGVPSPHVRSCLRKCPSLLAHEPRSLGTKVQDFQHLLCLSRAQVLDLVLRMPVLLTHSPRTLTHKLDSLAALFRPPTPHQQPEPLGSQHAAASMGPSSVQSQLAAESLGPDLRGAQISEGPRSQHAAAILGPSSVRAHDKHGAQQQASKPAPSNKQAASIKETQQHEQAQQSLALRLALAEPHLLTQAPGSLRAKLVAIAEHLGIPLQQAKQVVLRCPTLLALSTRQLTQRMQQLAWAIEGDLELELDRRLTPTPAVTPPPPHVHMHAPTKAAEGGQQSVGQEIPPGGLQEHAGVQEEGVERVPASTWSNGRVAEAKAVQEAVCLLVCHWPQVLVDAEGMPPMLRQQTVGSLADIGTKKRRQKFE